MYFLPDQVNEYDLARITTEVEPIQFSMFVTNEKLQDLGCINN